MFVKGQIENVIFFLHQFSLDSCDFVSFQPSLLMDAKCWSKAASVENWQVMFWVRTLLPTEPIHRR